MKAIFMFPGQSSKYPEMVERALEWAPDETLHTFGVASEVLGRDLCAHYRSDNPDIFARNLDVQLGVFLTSHVHLLALERAGVRADLSLGLSLGEYNHLVHAGALSLVDAVRLVDARGRAYDEGPDGAMASAFPLPIEDLGPVLERARAHGPIEIANLNSPTQHVLSGARAAIEVAAAIVQEELGAECVIIERRVPMHASIFKPAARAFRPALEHTPWRTPRLPYLPNTLGRFEPDVTPARITRLLSMHVHSPVLWRESIELCAELHPDAAFIEVGPRSVLYNLLSRRWIKSPRYRTDTPDDPGAAIVSIAKELGHAA